MKYEAYFKKYLGAIERTLEEVLPPEQQHPPRIHEAMRYAVSGGGKRFRPLLAMLACEAAGADPDHALLPGAAIELIHTYSLVHDDLPALDNDDYRRGKLACHRRFGEAGAVLTGDGLLTLAFQVLARIQPSRVAVQMLEEISTAAGTYGMIGGQVADLDALAKEPDIPLLDYISVHKTGKLIRASAVCGAIAAGASRDIQDRMGKFGEFLGLAFQVVDDLLDGDGYMKLMKSKEVRGKARDLIAKAKREIRPCGRRGDRLQALADFLLKRVPK